MTRVAAILYVMKPEARNPKPETSTNAQNSRSDEDNRVRGDGSLEAMGFLFRWCLLGLVGLSMLGMAWGSVAATRAIAESLEFDVVTSDGIWDADNPGPAVARGYIVPRSSHKGSGVVTFYSVAPGRIPTMVPQEHQRAFPKVYSPEVGLNVVHLRGIPYGAFAFKHTTVRFLVVPRDRDVFLVDARWILSVHQENSKLPLDILQLLRWRGEVVVFHPGPLEDFVADRRQLRSIGVWSPAICTVKHGYDPMLTLWHSAAVLGRELVVVTDDPQLAYLCATDERKRFFVHWIDSDSREIDSPKLQRHTSASKFKEYLTVGPIRK